MSADVRIRQGKPRAVNLLCPPPHERYTHTHTHTFSGTNTQMHWQTHTNTQYCCESQKSLALFQTRRDDTAKQWLAETGPKRTCKTLHYPESEVRETTPIHTSSSATRQDRTRPAARIPVTETDVTSSTSRAPGRHRMRFSHFTLTRLVMDNRIIGFTLLGLTGMIESNWWETDV